MLVCSFPAYIHAAAMCVCVLFCVVTAPRVFLNCIIAIRSKCLRRIMGRVRVLLGFARVALTRACRHRKERREAFRMRW